MSNEKHIVERIAVIETKLESIENKLDEFIERADNKYAPIWVVKVLSWVLGIITIVGTSLLIKYL